MWQPYVNYMCSLFFTSPLCERSLQPYDLSRTAEVSINRALASPHSCLSTPQTLPLSSLGPPDKLPQCLKVGHYRPPEHHRAPHWALIAISSKLPCAPLEARRWMESLVQYVGCKLSHKCLLCPYVSYSLCYSNQGVIWHLQCEAAHWPFW